MSKILEVKDLHFKYGEIQALRGISFEIEDGEVVSLIGGNGAGKTTTLQAVSGLISGITQGEVWLDGKRIDHQKPHLIAKMGIAQCIEGRHIFSQLTVKENLLMGAYMRKGPEINEDLDYVYGLFPRLFERKGQQGGTLSGGEQQMLAVGRALMQRPKILMLDEPSLGLAPRIIEDIFTIIEKINKDGMPILLVEQNSNAALQVSHRGYVIETGEIKITDTAKNLLNNEEIKKSYLGIQ